MLHITNHSKKHKMAGFQSLNTDTTSNPFCQAMRGNCSSVCCACYAQPQLNRYKDLKSHCQENSETLSTTRIQGFGVMGKAFRFNSFGELINALHFENLLTIVRYNPNTVFTLWTKRADIVQSVLAEQEKPANLILIYSSPLKNVTARLPQGFDKVFTVFQKRYVDENGVNINCPKSCAQCMICYSHNDVIEVNEELR